MSYPWNIGDEVNASELNSKFDLSFGGDGSDGALAITTGTTDIDLGAVSVVELNYTSISITGTGKLTFSNPATHGTMIVLKSQGDVTLTSSETPMIDASGMGAAGGNKGTISNNVNEAGAIGYDGYCSLIKTNGAVAPTTSAVGTGGAIATTIAFIVNSFKYFNAWVGSGGSTGSTASSASGNWTPANTGGRGGGCLVIECAGAFNFTTASGISVNGKDGSDGVDGPGSYRNVAGGGGGAGGFFLALYNTLTANTGTVTIAGGIGGDNSTGTTSSNTVYGGGGGSSADIVGGDGSSSGSSGVTTGGTGSVGLSSVQENKVF